MFEGLKDMVGDTVGIPLGTEVEGTPLGMIVGKADVGVALGILELGS